MYPRPFRGNVPYPDHKGASPYRRRVTPSLTRYLDYAPAYPTEFTVRRFLRAVDNPMALVHAMFVMVCARCFSSHALHSRIYSQWLPRLYFDCTLNLPRKHVVLSSIQAAPLHSVCQIQNKPVHGGGLSSLPSFRAEIDSHISWFKG